jgi:histidinol-phosphate/aromatic aminotransferase/cobyric acid decarboxylase-like protein
MVAFAQEKGIILRPQNAMYGRDGWFRLTLGSKEENRMAIKAIQEFYSQ